MKSGLVDNAPPQPSNANGLKPRHHHHDPPENGVGVVDHSANGNGARCDDRPAAYVANNRDAIYRWQSFDYDRVPPIDWEHYGQVTFMLLGCFSGSSNSSPFRKTRAFATCQKSCLVRASCIPELLKMFTCRRLISIP